MKKTILFFSLLLLGAGAYAQSGSLTINNRSKGCTLYVNMWAVDPTTGNGSGCDLAGCLFILPPPPALTSTMTWSSAGAYGLTGFCGEATPVPVAYWYGAITTFQWTDIQFQYNCPDMPCSSGGALTEAPLVPLSLSCRNAPTTFAGYCGQTAQWVSSTPGMPMSDITVNFW